MRVWRTAFSSVPGGEFLHRFGPRIAPTFRRGHKGYVSLEQDKYPGDMKETCRRYLRTMRELIG